jgi:malonate transporter MadL subunit
MTIFGVALLALCTLVGVFIGDLLGVALQVKANPELERGGKVIGGSFRPGDPEHAIAGAKEV